MRIEKHAHITATELVRNLSAAIDQVRFSRRPLWITKGNQTIAELSPPPKNGYPISRLGEMLASLPTLGEGAADMHADQNHIRHQAVLPGNPWDL